ELARDRVVVAAPGDVAEILLAEALGEMRGRGIGGVARPGPVVAAQQRGVEAPVAQRLDGRGGGVHGGSLPHPGPGRLDPDQADARDWAICPTRARPLRPIMVPGPVHDDPRALPGAGRWRARTRPAPVPIVPDRLDRDQGPAAAPRLPFRTFN